MPPSTAEKLDKLGAQLWLDLMGPDWRTSAVLQGLAQGSLHGVRLGPQGYDNTFGDGSCPPALSDILLDSADLGVEPLFSRMLGMDAKTLGEALLPLHQSSQGQKGWVVIDRPDWDSLPPAAAVAQFSGLVRNAGVPNLIFSVSGTESHAPLVAHAATAGISLCLRLHGCTPQLEELLRAFKQGCQARPEGTPPPLLAISVNLGCLAEALSPLLPAFFPDRAAVPIAYGRILHEQYQLLFSRLQLRTLRDSGVQPPLLVWEAHGLAATLTDDERATLESLIGSRIALLAGRDVVDDFQRFGRVQLSVIEEVEDAEALLEKLKRLGIQPDAACARGAAKLDEHTARRFDAALDALSQCRRAMCAASEA